MMPVRYLPAPISVSLGCDEATLHLRAPRRFQQASSDGHVLDDVMPPQLSSHPAMQALVSARSAQPDNATTHRELAEAARRLGSPPAVEAYLWSAAILYDPGDSYLAIRYANALKDRAEELSNSSNHVLHRASQVKSLAAFKRVLSFGDRLEWPAKKLALAHANVGGILYKLGRFKECESSFRSSVSLLPLLRESIGKSAALAPRPTREVAARQSRELLQVLHGLDMCLLQQGKRKRAREVQDLGVSLGLWKVPEQRPHTLAEGILACAWHRPAAYGRVVSLLEAEAPRIWLELKGLLRLREVGDARETSAWYQDTEHIAARPSQWLRRRLACEVGPGSDDDDHGAEATPVTCAAITAAARWYGGEDAVGFEGALFSLLAAGSHVRSHTGPTNERVAVSLGLANVEGAFLRVGRHSPPRQWREGKAHVFDDSFEHEVIHEGNSARAVLILHLRHPMLMPDSAQCPVRLTAKDPCG